MMCVRALKTAFKSFNARINADNAIQQALKIKMDEEVCSHSTRPSETNWNALLKVPATPPKPVPAPRWISWASQTPHRQGICARPSGSYAAACVHTDDSWVR